LCCLVFKISSLAITNLQRKFDKLLFLSYLLGWETLVTNPNAINTVRHHVRFGDVLDIEFQEGNVQDLVVVAKHLWFCGI